jgi:glycosyltransferase involved in cell wall biosynthesis
MTAISVVIPTFNRAHLLPRTIGSVLAQSHADLEVIVVDDAGTDPTETVVAGLNDGRIRYIRHLENRGPAGARNTGIGAARHSFVAFLDSDDVWLPEKLAKQLDIFSHSPVHPGLVYTGFARTDSTEGAGSERYRGNVHHRLLAGNFVGTASTLLVKRECFDQVGLFDEQLPPCGEDWEMWIRIAERYAVDYVDENLVLYYLQPESISRNDRANAAGLRQVSAKHRRAIQALPRELRAEHYFYLGRNLWYAKDVPGSLRYCAAAALVHPPLVPRVFDFLVLAKLRKLLGA